MTVYVVETDGLAVIEFPLVALNPVPGAHVYDAAPAAVNNALLPEQTMAFGVTETFGVWVTCTATVAVFEQPFVVPVTEYVMLDAGDAVTFVPLVAERLVEGLQE